MKRLDTPNGRFYETEKGTFPSVTTILGQTMTAKKRAKLEDWQSGEPNHKLILQEACDRGTYLHRRVEIALGGGNLPAYSQHEKDVLVPQYWKAFLPFIRKIKHPVCMERQVYNPVVGYAGTLDLLAKPYASATVCEIWDWKNARGWKKKEWIEDYFLQIAAYRVAVGHSMDPAPIISRGNVVIALPNGTAQHFQLTRAELQYYFMQFKRRVHEFRSLGRGSRVSVSTTRRLFQQLGR